MSAAFADASAASDHQEACGLLLQEPLQFLKLDSSANETGQGYSLRSGLEIEIYKF